MISISVVSIAVISVLLFGSVEVWAFALVGLITLVVFNIWIYGDIGVLGISPSRWQKTLYISLSGLVLLYIFQIIPLPASLLRFLSHRSYELMKEVYTGPFSSGSIGFCSYCTLNGIVRLVIYVMIFFMAASLTGRDGLMRRTMTAVVIFGFVIAFFAIIQKASWNGRIYWFRELTQGGAPFGPFVNRNDFAGFIGMIVPLGLSLSLEEQKTEKKLILMFLTLIMTLGIFYSLSRGGIISFLLSMVFFVFLVVTRGFSRRYIHYLLIFLSGLIFYLLYLGVSPIVNRFVESGLSSEQRIMVWKETLRAFSDFAWFGTGLGTFRYVFPLYYPQGLTGTFYYAHNDYLQFLLETGIVGTLLLTAGFISITVPAFIAYRNNNDSSVITAGLLASVFYMLVHSFFDFNLHLPSNAIMFSIILGFLYGLGVKGFSPLTEPGKLRSYSLPGDNR